MVSMRIRLVSGVAVMLAALLAFGPGTGRAQVASRTFAETGKTVSGRFLEYWDAHGGLAQQGFPISELMQEVSDTDGKSYSVQYFERAVFEAHPENAAPYDVLLSLLGVFEYGQQYAGTQGAPGQAANNEAGARKFMETGKTVGGLFLKYWNEHGGLAQQGFPISEEFTEVSALNGKPYKVQYFERAVFEAHPENTAPYDVLLSQLGTLRYREKHAGGGSPTSVPALSQTATSIPAATFTPVPPTNTPKPTKEVTPAPTMCPAFGDLGLSVADGHFNATVRWNVRGGGANVESSVSVEGDSGDTSPRSGGRTGEMTYWPRPACNGLPNSVDVTFRLEVRDECGQTASDEASITLYREPCP